MFIQCSLLIYHRFKIALPVIDDCRVRDARELREKILESRQDKARDKIFCRRPISLNMNGKWRFERDAN